MNFLTPIYNDGTSNSTPKYFSIQKALGRKHLLMQFVGFIFFFLPVGYPKLSIFQREVGLRAPLNCCHLCSQGYIRWEHNPTQWVLKRPRKEPYHWSSKAGLQAAKELHVFPASKKAKKHLSHEFTHFHLCLFFFFILCEPDFDVCESGPGQGGLRLEWMTGA